RNPLLRQRVDDAGYRPIGLKRDADRSPFPRGRLLGRGMQTDDQSVRRLHGRPVIAEALGEFEAERLRVEVYGLVHVGYENGNVAAGDHVVVLMVTGFALTGRTL